jgi:N-acetylmuramoyl-L-alanine amidase
LVRAGFDPGGVDGMYGSLTEGAVRSFQQSRGLDVDGICGPQTWGALIEAGHRLGDRLLYLHTPMLRGDDVAEAQRRLGALGFDAGRVDGILGPETARAVTDFQRNTGLVPDGICGRDTVVLLRRLSDRVDQHQTVSALREQEDLRGAPPTLAEWRVALGEPGGLDVVTASVRRRLAERGASVVTLHHPDWSTQARRANRFGAGVYVGVVLRDCTSEVCYFASDGFESRPGHALADAVAAHAADTVGPLAVRGMRLPILRETAMPAVLCRLDPTSWSVRHTGRLAHDLRDAMTSWVTTQRA